MFLLVFHANEVRVIFWECTRLPVRANHSQTLGGKRYSRPLADFARPFEWTTARYCKLSPRRRAHTPCAQSDSGGARAGKNLSSAKSWYDAGRSEKNAAINYFLIDEFVVPLELFLLRKWRLYEDIFEVVLKLG